ncbi:MAG: hypothetical protein U9Q98_07860 [Bacteroidota bacterium]|nr:hypothetical protein [Bacteroidota bacterium]
MTCIDKAYFTDFLNLAEKFLKGREKLDYDNGNAQTNGFDICNLLRVPYKQKESQEFLISAAVTGKIKVSE